MSAEAPNITTKAAIRQHIWDHIERNNLANFPRPVHHRIPNFKGANAAGEKVVAMDIFKKAKTIKVNPDKPQEWVRYMTLEEGKVLLVPTPRLKTGLFNRILPPTGANTAILKKCATREGITHYSAPVGLEHKITIDLIVIGSVAVSSKGMVRDHFRVLWMIRQYLEPVWQVTTWIKKKGEGGRVQLSGGLLSSVLKAFHNSSLSALTPQQQYAYSSHCTRSIHFLKCWWGEFV